MSQYAVYVWSSYLCAFFLLGALLCSILLEWRSVLKTLMQSSSQDVCKLP